MRDVKDEVRDRYAAAARRLTAGGAGCCGPAEPAGADFVKDYTQADGQAADLLSQSLGCGNPTMLAEFREGERVLDLGSGAGLDVFLSARRVGPTGHVYGVDMTDEMLALAERNRDRMGLANASFLRGAIEAVPLPAESVDVVISNCVINLAEDKGAVLEEAFRVLRPGGRLAVADMVEVERLAPEVKMAAEQWAGCIAGTIPAGEYRDLLLEAGFEDAEIEVHAVTEVPGGGRVGSAYVRARKPRSG